MRAGFRHAPDSLRLLCLLLLGAVSSQAKAITLNVGTTGGLMQQPTSHYYHAIYGAYVEGASAAEKLLVRAAYVERPEFRYAGYIDKDYGWFGLIGTKLTKAKDHGLFAFIGGGRMAGYVKTDPATNPQSLPERSYGLPGPTVALEYALRWHGLALAVNHQTFVGYEDSTQLKAYVAWPYNFFQFNVGYSW